MLATTWTLLKSAINGYIADNALSRGAAIAYYTVFSLAPVLVIVIAIAGLVFDADAARGAIVAQMSGLMGEQGAAAIQAMIKGASNRTAGGIATAVGFVTLLITATGVFSEMQAALNDVWKAQPQTDTVTQLVKVRLISLGLVMALGFMLIVSLVVSAALTALGTWLNSLFPGAQLVLRIVSLVISFGLLSVLFAVIYKVLPDTRLAWRDVIVGGVATALLFTIGKYLIGLYIGSSSTATSFGAAGALAVVLLWVYYSSQIFLFGAEFTRAYADIVHGRREGGSPAQPTPPTTEITGHPELDRLKAELATAQAPRVK
jgi:membrane protein